MKRQFATLQEDVKKFTFKGNLSQALEVKCSSSIERLGNMLSKLDSEIKTSKDLIKQADIVTSRDVDVYTGCMA